MPTLAELRRQFRLGSHTVAPAEEVEPDDEDEEALGKAKERAAYELVAASGGGRWSSLDDGKDAILHFGMHTGKKLSDIMLVDRGYLRWIVKSDFPDKLKEIAKHLLGAPVRAGSLMHVGAVVFSEMDRLAEVMRSKLDESAKSFSKKMTGTGYDLLIIDDPIMSERRGE